MIFKNLCFLVLWTKVASALEGLKGTIQFRIMVGPVPIVQPIPVHVVDARLTCGGMVLNGQPQVLTLPMLRLLSA